MLSIYKASAGSGKTHTLTREYLVMLFRDYRKCNEHFMPHSRILAVTFTKKSTAEMKERIGKALKKAINEYDYGFDFLEQVGDDVAYGLKTC